MAKKPVADYPHTNILETMQAELDECVALLRPHYPSEDDDILRERAMRLRPGRYEKGRWPSAEEIEEDKAKAERLKRQEGIDREDAATP